MADLICLEDYTIADDGNFGSFRNFPEKNVASYPSGASGGCGQRFSFCNDFGNKEALGNNNEIVHRIAVIVQEKETGIVERGDAVYHGAIDAIVDGVAEAVGGGFLALQFVLGEAVPADVVFDRGVGFGFVDGHGAADGAIHVAGEPVFGEDAGLLSGASISPYQCGVEFQIHMCTVLHVHILPEINGESSI